MKARLTLSVLILAMVPVSLTAQSIPRAVAETEMTVARTADTLLVTATNRGSTAVEALILRVYFHRSSDGKLMRRDQHFLDRVASAGRDHALAPGAAVSSPAVAASDRSAPAEPVICGVIMVGGVTAGEQECIAEILNRRRSILLGARAALSTLDDASRQGLDKEAVVARLNALRAPMPWDVERPGAGTANHPTLSWVREAIAGASVADFGRAIESARDQWRAKISLLEASKPPLD